MNDEIRTSVEIAVHAFDGMTMFHLATPLLVFGEVSRLGLAPGWRTRVWTQDGRGIRTAEGLRVEDVAGPEVVPGADILVLPSWPADLPRAGDELVHVVSRAHAGGSTVVGLCLGAFPVSDSALLDGRGAVTHWAAAPLLQQRRTAVQVNASALYLDHGDVLTSAGTASGLDACLHVVRTRLGSAAANTLARHLVVAPHRDGDQAQFVQRPVPEPGGVGPIGATMEWALANLDRDLSVEQLAGHARMSGRNFTRRFTEAVGTTPARWILTQRLEEVRRLLETTTWSIERTARACGFRSAVTLRQNFTAAYATTPTSYRQRFRVPDGA
ncbi:GlxA family transcriptional regulator [Geodermatophilus sabuli]|uniref:Transcriptional regulator, AraC family with amidase-like domain n=1 Tax=Geodermatophilus sabuli TaxID=1564158 RepID=A0A285EEU5_9ACTN|nr:helix-turn-helix domain-containing protein [Geodermatophilus sabuli]MBB3084130.1 transcriptional regulator GlxA family with amidase domain [Geodermatophilus sabuli]SNX96596.1 transcriptional regulator, AraC family with amidase-like domain [Geodermatophilus sabuli]